jgi:SAM-dependent methyltransferase
MRLRGLCVRVCLRRRRAVTGPDFSLPMREPLAVQSARLSGLRARLLRRAQIGLRRAILDLGCGYGAVTPELVRRGGPLVVALDRQHAALADRPAAFAGAHRICGRAERLPLGDATFDLVYSQFALMWMNASSVVAEVWRVLRPGGVFIAIEPDYGGMIEWPETIRTKHLWESALQRAGADPRVGRALLPILARCGFDLRVDLVPELTAAATERLDLLRGLPLSPAERSDLDRIDHTERTLMTPWNSIAHLPIFLITASVPAAD